MIKAGPLAATVADAALAYLAMAGGETRTSSGGTSPGDSPVADDGSGHNGDSNQQQQPQQPHFYTVLYGGSGPPPAHLGGAPLGPRPSSSLRGLRLGVFWPHFRDGDPAVVAACERALDQLREASGVELVPVALPNVGWLRLAHAMKISTEFALAW
jgi:Asp-tRNA(Asn)/Glu-tRNA(Gln) amidotransferase A subunit family amidase